MEFDLKTLIRNKAELSEEEVTQLYLKDPGVWVILEIMEKNSAGKAVKLRPVQYAANKEVLRNFLLDMEDWEDGEKLIYFFTGFDGTCEINY